MKISLENTRVDNFYSIYIYILKEIVYGFVAKYKMQYAHDV